MVGELAGPPRAGRLHEAHTVLGRAFTFTDHGGRYAEQLPAAGEHLGNVPRAR